MTPHRKAMLHGTVRTLTVSFRRELKPQKKYQGDHLVGHKRGSFSPAKRSTGTCTEVNIIKVETIMVSIIWI